MERLTVLGQRQQQLTGRLPNAKFTASVLDTPRTVSVITKVQIREANATTMEQAFSTIPGVSFRGGDAYAVPGGDYPVIRGFDSYSSLFIDGLRDSGVQSRETFDVDEIEVLKGPSSAYSVRGALGGQVNITTKKAQLGNLTEGSVGFGTANYKRGTIDINRQIAPTAAFRLKAMGFEGDKAGRAPVGGNRYGVAPSLSFGLVTPTRVTLGYYHMVDNELPDYSAPYTKGGGTPVDIPRGTFLGLANRDFQRSSVNIGQVIVTHDLNSHFTIGNTTQWTSSQFNYIATNPRWNSSTSSDDIIALEAKSGIYHTDNLQHQTMFSRHFATGPLKHSINVGVELSRERATRDTYAVRDASGAVIRNAGSCSVACDCISLSQISAWNPYAAWNASISQGEPGIPVLNTTVTEGGAYAFDTISMLNDHLLFNGGVRFDRYMTYASRATARSAATTA